MRKETGLVFDRSMAEHECLWDPNYPECPARLTRVLQRCEELGLMQRCKLVESRCAAENELLSKHSQKQIDILKATDGSIDSENLELLSSKYDAIYIHPVCARDKFIFFLVRKVTKIVIKISNVAKLTF